MAGKNPLHPIPHPARKPIVGNLLSIGSDSPVLDMWKIAQDLGGIYWLDMPGMPVVVISDHELVNELVDEKRFDKSTNGALRRLRAGSHGLFTSGTPALVMIALLAWAGARIGRDAPQDARWAAPEAAFRRWVLPEFEMRLGIVKRACEAVTAQRAPA